MVNLSENQLLRFTAGKEQLAQQGSQSPLSPEWRRQDTQGGATTVSHIPILYGGWAVTVFAENLTSLFPLVSELSDLASQEQKKILDGNLYTEF